MGSQPNQSALPFESFTTPEKHNAVTPFDVSLLALNRVRGLGRKSLTTLVKVFGEDLGQVWEEPREKIRDVLTNAKNPTAEDIASEITTDKTSLIMWGKSKVHELAKRRIYVIGPSDLPVTLQEIPDPPSWLFVQGNVHLLHEDPFVAIVGTRKPTKQGCEATKIVVRQMATYPIVLVSGLAEGIDEQAHSASLEEGVANVAFLGHGIDAPFIPARNKMLRARIVEEGGAVVSEYLPDEHFQKSYFVQRNRLQAALADLVIPVEANPKGGTAHTVRFARRYKRRILGVRWPGTNGILEELRREGYPSVSIFDAAGRKELDETFRVLAEHAEHHTYALHVAERRLREELEGRNARPEDLDRLVHFLGRFMDGRG